MAMSELPSMNLFSKNVVTGEEEAEYDVAVELRDTPTGKEDAEEEYQSGDDEDCMEDGDDFDAEDLFKSLTTGEDETFAFTISDDEEHVNFAFKTSTEDLEEVAANEETNVYNEQESINKRKDSGVMSSALTSQLSQLGKRTESGTTTPAQNNRMNRLPNAFKVAGDAGEVNERDRTAPIPDLPSISAFSKDPQLINPSVKTRSTKPNNQAASRKSFEVMGGSLEETTNDNFVQKNMWRSRESAGVSVAVSSDDEDGTPVFSNSEFDENFNEDEDDFGQVPQSRRNQTMIDHKARNRDMLQSRLSMREICGYEFFAPEPSGVKDEVTEPRHKETFAVSIVPKGRAEDSIEGQRLVPDSVSVSKLVDEDEKVSDEIFRYLRTVLEKASNDMALDNLKRLKRVFEENLAKRKEVTKERDHLISSHIDFVSTVAEAMSHMKSNPGGWVTLT